MCLRRFNPNIRTYPVSSVPVLVAFAVSVLVIRNAFLRGSCKLEGSLRTRRGSVAPSSDLLRFPLRSTRRTVNATVVSLMLV
eukprot:IDg10494t1